MQLTQLIIIARCKNGGKGPTIINSSFLLLQKEYNSTTIFQNKSGYVSAIQGRINPRSNPTTKLVLP